MKTAACSDRSHQCICESLVRIVDLLPWGVWVIAADGSVEYANRAVQELPPRIRDLAAWSNGEALRLLATGEGEILILREGDRKECLATAQRSLSSKLLKALYRLSPAESRVACELTAGKTPREVSVSLGISLHTVRTHIKNVLAKTGCRSQNELVARLAVGLATLRFNERNFTQLGDSSTEAER
jgi:DNA-binding CsgD family transcriptional regulator